MTTKPKPRKHNPEWKDTTRAARQAKRLSKLNEAAQRCGFETWRRLETAVINGARLAVTPLAELEEAQRIIAAQAEYYGCPHCGKPIGISPPPAPPGQIA